MQFSPVIQAQAVIFDLDGTLIDFEGVSHVALEAPLARRGAKLPWERGGVMVWGWGWPIIWVYGTTHETWRFWGLFFLFFAVSQINILRMILITVVVLEF